MARDRTTQQSLPAGIHSTNGSERSGRAMLSCMGIETKELSGVFWLPDIPEVRVPGTLVLDPAGKGYPCG